MMTDHKKGGRKSARPFPLTRKEFLLYDVCKIADCGF